MTSRQITFLALFITTAIASIIAGSILPVTLATTVISGLCTVAVLYILFG